MKNKAKPDAQYLRQKAEDLLRKKTISTGSELSDIDIRNFFHELEVHQLELELQNEELRMAKIAEQIAAEKYHELYDFAPTGYFTLSKKGEIIDVNLYGSQMLGKERSRLKGNRFGLFVTDDTKPIFNSFFEKIFVSKTKETCEVILSINGNIPMDVHLSGIVDKDEEHCLVSLTDITNRKVAENELREKEVQFYNLANSGLALIWIADINKLCTYFNDVWLNFTGRTLSEELGNGWTEGVHPDDFDRCLDTYVTAFDKHESFSMEYRIHHRSGEYRWLLDLGTPNYNSKGEFIGYIGNCFDISDRKQAEEALRESEERYLQILQNSGAGIGIYSLDGTILWYNEIALRNIGGKAADIIGKTLSEIFGAQAASVFVERIQIAAKSPDNIEFEELVKLSSGDHWYLSSYSKVINPDGSVTSVQVIAQDITARKNAEIALRESQSLYFSFIEQLPDAVFRKDLEGRFILVNSHFCTLKGLTTEDFIGKKPMDIAKSAIAIKGEQDHATKYYSFGEDMHELILKTGKAYDNEEEYTNSIGNKQYMHIKRMPVFGSEGEIIGTQGIMFDITTRKLAGEELRKGEARQSKMVANIGDVIVVFDKDGINRYISPNVEKLFGWKPEEIVGASSSVNVYPGDKESVDRFVRTLANEPNVKGTTELRYRNKDGSYKWIEITVVNLLHDPDIQGILGNYHDITERKQIEKELQSSYNMLNKLTAQVPGVVYQYRLYPDGRSAFPYSSPGMFDIYECTSEEVREDATPIYIRIHPDDRDRVMETILESARNLTIYHSEFRVILPKQGLRWRLCDAKPERMDDGSTLWYGIITDITERKQAEERLKKVTAAVENTKASVVITDSKGMIEYANPYFTQLTGYTPDEYIGKKPSILKSGYHSKEFYEELWYTINSGNTWEGEFYNIKKNGESFWEYSIISPIHDDSNEITHFVSVKTDITVAKQINEELKEAKEHAEESDRLKTAFLANMSHEIRTPMNGILGFAGLLKEPDLTGEEQQEYISIIEKSGARMLNIINDIVDISKIESGLMELNMKESNINEQIEYIYTFFKPEVERKGMQLYFHNSLAKKESVLHTDREKVFAILTNLVKNAIKFSDNGYIELGYDLVVETHGASDGLSVGTSDSKSLQFYVRDTGIGIPKDRQEAIFDRFIQADIGDKRAFQGAGLGLSISKAYVEMLGGKIWVESEEGKGSTFYFTIPYSTECEEKKVINNIDPHGTESKIKNLTVLIAEDDETSAMLIEMALKGVSREILKARTGVEAVEVCRNNPDIDLILMDIKMPEMDGYEAAKQIRQFNKELVIIAQTAYALAGDRERAIAAGCNDYIAKPFGRNTLTMLIEKHIKKVV